MWDVAELFLYRNSIEEIPNGWSVFMNRLDLSHNNIKFIPENWEVRINYLDLSCNSIEKIPEGWHPNIRELDLHGNPICQESLRIFRENNPDIFVNFFTCTYTKKMKRT